MPTSLVAVEQDGESDEQRNKKRVSPCLVINYEYLYFLSFNKDWSNQVWGFCFLCQSSVLLTRQGNLVLSSSRSHCVETTQAAS